MFVKIGTAFINEYTKEFGTDHIYNTDTFNEINPPSNSTTYLDKAGKAVFEAMTTADPSAVWLMQGWLFLQPFWKNEQVEALVRSVPQVSLWTILRVSYTMELLICRAA